MRTKRKNDKLAAIVTTLAGTKTIIDLLCIQDALDDMAVDAEGQGRKSLAKHLAKLVKGVNMLVMRDA